MKTIIIGGVAGGATAAARLRRLDEQHEIILLERGEYISFANCGLPYYISGAIPAKKNLLLQTPDSFSTRYKVDVRVRNEVTEIDRDNKTVTVKNHIDNTLYKESYDQLIISTGAEPIKPEIQGMELPQVFTLRSVPDVERIKDHMQNYNCKTAVVVGGGAIGIEVAENLVLAGLNVTLVEAASHILSSIDDDMAIYVQKELQKNGLKIITNNAIRSISKNEHGITARLEYGELDADLLIISIGVRPESSIAKNAGIEVNSRGGIVVNEYMHTSVSDIFAVGDAVEVVDFISGAKTQIPLAGPANKQGRIVADNATGKKSVYKGTQGSFVLKCFSKTVACTGLNEIAARKAGINYEKIVIFPLSHAGYYPGAEKMVLKLLFEMPSGKVLGTQIIGKDGVDKRCDVIATAMRFGATVYNLTELELCYAPPYGSAKDPVNMAGYVAQNIVDGRVKQAHWSDLKNVDLNTITLLDVRTNREVLGGGIAGAKHIPLDELRGRIREISKDKPVYISCLSGLRSYLAYNILNKVGYDCYNISGGYELYSATKQV